MEQIRNFLLTRLTQPSTWRGIVALATAFGATISPEMQEQIIAVGLAVMGLIGIASDEHKAAKKVAARTAENVAESTAESVATTTAANVADQAASTQSEELETLRQQVGVLTAQLQGMQKKSILPWLNLNGK